MRVVCVLRLHDSSSVHRCELTKTPRLMRGHVTLCIHRYGYAIDSDSTPIPTPHVQVRVRLSIRGTLQQQQRRGQQGASAASVTRDSSPDWNGRQTHPSIQFQALCNGQCHLASVCRSCDFRCSKTFFLSLYRYLFGISLIFSLSFQILSCLLFSSIQRVGDPETSHYSCM